MASQWTNLDLLQENIGRTERYLRLIVGGLLVGLVFVGETHWGWIGLYPLITGFLSVCPVRRVFATRAKPELDS